MTIYYYYYYYYYYNYNYNYNYTSIQTSHLPEDPPTQVGMIVIEVPDVDVVIIMEATDVVIVVDDIIVMETDDVVILVGPVDNVVVVVIDVTSV